MIDVLFKENSYRVRKCGGFSFRLSRVDFSRSSWESSSRVVLQDVALPLATRLVHLDKLVSNWWGGYCHLVTILAVEVLGGLQDGQVELWNGGWRNLGMSLGKVVDEHTWGKGKGIFECMKLFL